MTLQPEYVVRGYWQTEHSDQCPRGSGHCEEQRLVQRLILRTPMKFLWWTFWWEKIIDEELVPNHVWITEAAFGDNGGWKSKFAKYIK